jgi:hypothetical protein
MADVPALSRPCMTCVFHTLVPPRAFPERHLCHHYALPREPDRQTVMPMSCELMRAYPQGCGPQGRFYAARSGK